MKVPLFSLMALCLVPLAAPAAILLNEVHLNVPGPDDNYEFIELRSTTNGVESCAGLSLVIINNALSDDGVRLNPGEILEVFDLNEFSTGSNGLLLLGNGYAASPPGGPWAGAIDSATAVADPAGMGDSDIRTNTGLTVLLVRNFNKTAGVRGADIDVDPFTGTGSSPISTGNGVIDWKQTPPPAGALPQLWADADVIDSIAIRDVADNRDPVDVAAAGNRNPYTTANLTSTWAIETNDFLRRDPETFARRLSNLTINQASAWYGGQTRDGSTLPTEVIYRTGRTFGPNGMIGQVTPGRANLDSTLPPTDFRINEVGLNPPGSGINRFQYVEIINTSGQSRSLSGYWLVLIDSFDGSANAGDTTGVGRIIEEWNLSDFVTGTNGLLLLGDGFSPAYTSFQDMISPQTALADPAARSSSPVSSGWGEGDLGFKDGFTMVLLRSYLPPTLRDFDTAPEDGILDSNPWNVANVADQIGFNQAGKTGIGRTYSSIDLRRIMAPTTIPSNFSRKPGDFSNAFNASLALDATKAWYGGVYPGGSSPMTIGFQDATPVNPGDTFAATWFGGFRGAGTPGLPNLSAPVNPAVPPVSASIRINEVMINPTNDPTVNNDANNEYIELAGTNEGLAYLDGLFVLVVDLNGTIGNIQTGFPLNGYTTGTNGIALLGDGYDNTNGPYLSSQGTLPPGSAAFDPPVGLEGNQLPNNGCAILLVRGIKGPITLNAGGRPIGDLAPDNDGILLPPADYTDELVDSIVVNTVNPGAGYGWVNNTFFNPHHIARYPRTFTASNAASWYGGQVPQTTDAFPFTNYTGSFFGTFQGAGSPGRANHSATPGPVNVGDVVLNEVNINPAGADDNFEFIEILSTDGAARSLNGYSILAIDNVISNTGSIRQAWSLDGMSTGSNGLFLMGNRYPTPADNPWTRVMRPQSFNGDPIGREGLSSSLNDNMIGGDTDNTNLTLLLVRNFNRYIDYDIDDKSPNPPNPLPSPPPAGPPYDSVGDGVFDTFPWAGGSAGIHDSIVLRSYIATIPPPAVPGPTYPWDGWTYSLPDLSQTFFPSPAVRFYHPDSIARFRSETSPNNASAWYGGDLRGGTSGNTGTAEEYTTTAQDPTRPPVPAGFWGRLTPGQPNLIRSANTDPDNDGVPNLVEQAINTDPSSAASSGPLPAPALITDGGLTYLGFTYPRIRSNVIPVPFPYAAEAYIYRLETSPDLLTWTPADGALIPVGLLPANPDGVTENATVRLPAPVTTGPGRQYIRLRVERR